MVQAFGRRSLLRRRSLLIGAALAAATAPPAWARQAVKWRGFNLPDKMHVNNAAFRAADFAFMQENGFNFARIPTDYRNLVPPAGGGFAPYDEAVGWAREHGIHVNFALHHAPGYGVAGPPDGLSLFGTGPSALVARQNFAALWGRIAEHYRDVPVSALSFNLVNEPPKIDPALYSSIMQEAIGAIRRVTPARIIIADGLPGSIAAIPVPQLAASGVMQSLHAYAPASVSSYGASPWRKDDTAPSPHWPTTNVMNSYLFGQDKPQLNTALVIHGAFPAGTRVTLEIELVSNAVQVLIMADGLPIAQRLLSAMPDAAGQWKDDADLGPGKGHRALYAAPFTAVLPAAAGTLSLSAGHGDWMTFSRLVVARPGEPPLELVPGLSAWIPQRGFTLTPDGALMPVDGGPAHCDINTLWQDEMLPWVKAARAGLHVHVGEFGVNNATPNAVALAWMRDNLINFHRAGFGWALWNLRGGWGVLDSGRKDAQYETTPYGQLDRAMLELLKAY